MSKIINKNSLFSILTLFFIGFFLSQQSYAGKPEVEDLTGEINGVSKNLKYIKTGICPHTTKKIPCDPGSNFDKFIDDVGNGVERLNKKYGQQRDSCLSDLDILSRYQLFSSSFLSGVAYSVLPEIVRDALDSRGYSVTSNIGATLVQGGLIAYNTASYVPTITGFAVKIGFKNLGFSEQTSTTLASTAAVLASVVPALIFSPETATDCVVNCSVAIAGSYAGSTIALRAKSWIYDKWESYNRSSNEALLVAHITKLEEEVKKLKEERTTIYSLNSNSVETDKNK